MKKGKLIVFEGISGSGKETQVKLLKEYLTRHGIKSHVVYHPSPELKTILSEWRKNRHIDTISEAYFLLADRYDRVRQIIKPALTAGEWVISLRNFVSALVYQAKTASDREYLKKEFGWFEPKPDYLFYFDLNPTVALSRINKRGEPLGSFETMELLSEKRKIYENVLRKIPHLTIDASGSVDAIHTRLISCLPRKLQLL
mgnify:CR=1 FL=1